VRSFYEKDAEYYEARRFSTEFAQEMSDMQMNLVSRLLEGPRGTLFLDCGTGTGRIAQAFASDNMVVCVDFAPAMLRRLLESSPAVNVVCADLTELPFANKVFDACSAINVLNHVTRDQECLKEVSRVVKSSALVVVNFYNLTGLFLLIGLVVNLRGRSIIADVYSRWESYARMRRKLILSGLRPIDVKGGLVIPSSLQRVRVARPILRALVRIFTHSKLKYASATLFVCCRPISTKLVSSAPRV
jgi:ubiquinone/menaquinone biosynthesis C-methylase UbiE